MNWQSANILIYTDTKNNSMPLSGWCRGRMLLPSRQQAGYLCKATTLCRIIFGHQ
jgi:hypothetical protein